MQSLTKYQAKILEYLIGFIEKENYAPTVSEMIADFGYKSRNAIREPLIILERKGYITKQPAGSPRNVLVLFDSKQRPITYHIKRDEVTALEEKLRNLKTKTRLLLNLTASIKTELED
jgi:SOS-response transcriptional repressor LexA